MEAAIVKDAIVKDAIVKDAIVKDMDQRAVAAVVFMNTANECRAAQRPMDRFDTTGD